MKKIFQTALNSNLINKHNKKFKSLLYLILLMIVIITSCKKDAETDNRVKGQINNLNAQAASELRQAMAVTSKYQDIQNAFTDGYADINVIKPNMGYHFMKSDLTDSLFDVTKPEILVYNKKADSSFELVAIEYAVPFTQSTNAPEGFTGDDDMWMHSDEFGLWLLHAWVWKYNPDGIFMPMNPDVIVH